MPTRKSTTLSDVTQFSVGDGNWNTDRGPIQSIILHTMAGTVNGANARFNTPNSQVSAHYGVGLDGKLYQWVDEDNVAFHAGNYLVNQTSIGIEHEDGTNPQTNPMGYNNPRPDVLYATSAKIVADICKFYDFPADHDHIFRHEDVIDKTYCPGGTACPDALDTDRIIQMANEILNPTTPTTPSPLTQSTVFREDQLPSDIFNSTDGSIVTYNEQQVKVNVNSDGTRTLTPYTAPTEAVQTPSDALTSPQVDQNVSENLSNTPTQTVEKPSEPSFLASGQAGKVPPMVSAPVSKSVQSKHNLFKGIINLIINIFSFIGIEFKGKEAQK